MVKLVPIERWRALLKNERHDLRADARTAFAIDFLAEKTITIALEVLCWDPRFRQRYFVCPDPERVFGSLRGPEPLWLRWVELVSQQTASYWRDFREGPGSWLLSRLARFEEVVFWSDRALDWAGVYGATYRPSGMYFPEEATSFFLPSPGTPQPFGPRLATVCQRYFGEIVAGCILLANYGGTDCYVADAAAREVYLVNNDEMVIASIPDGACRKRFLQELQEANLPFRIITGHTRSPNHD